jgi:hypothetical protein
MRVQRGEQPRAAGTEYQDVSLEPFHKSADTKDTKDTKEIKAGFAE